ncbi:MAG: glutamate synthase-related protein [Methanoregulaceae archaeon]|nr:glutamate synthase-related protein [Methanoregulaceae archaeon]
MVRYRCNVCHVFEYNPLHGNSLTGIKPGTEVDDFPDTWRCPICDSDKSHLIRVPEEKPEETTVEAARKILLAVSHEEKKTLESYLGPWCRERDELEIHMEAIHLISRTGESIWEPMRTRRPVVSWDDILIKGAQIAQIPLNREVEVNTRTVIGPHAKQPLVIETPLYVTHMSFGALSREVKIALSKGSAAVKTAIGSGEGGILPEEMEHAYRYIFEYVPNRYSVTAHLPAEKVTREIADIRRYPEGTDIISPASYPDIRNSEELTAKVAWLREKSGGRPIGIKIAAGNIEADLDAILPAAPDFITIDGRPGATGAAPKFIKDATSVPTIFALSRARKFLDSHRGEGISLVVTGGFRVSSDFVKALALGADAIAIGTAALMASGCQQYRLCNTGKCPVGVTTHNPEFRERLKIDISARKLELFLRVSTEELKEFARLTGNADVHHLDLFDLCTTNSEISNHTDIEHV